MTFLPKLITLGDLIIIFLLLIIILLIVLYFRAQIKRIIELEKNVNNEINQMTEYIRECRNDIKNIYNCIKKGENKEKIEIIVEKQNVKRSKIKNLFMIK